MAAVLAYEPDALLSHQPAGVLSGFRPPPTGAIHVTVVGRDARGLSDVLCGVGVTDRPVGAGKASHVQPEVVIQRGRVVSVRAV